MKGVFYDVEGSHVVTAKAGKEVEQQRVLDSIADKSPNNAWHEVTSLRGRGVIASTRKIELLSSGSVASSLIAKTTFDIR